MYREFCRILTQNNIFLVIFEKNEKKGEHILRPSFKCLDANQKADLH